MGGKWSQKESASNMLEQVTYEIADFPIHSREWFLRGKTEWYFHGIGILKLNFYMWKRVKLPVV